MYIAGSFETVNRTKSGRGKEWIGNDPHFWTEPPTWGICRNDLRRKSKPGDTIIFVLPKHGKHPQMIFGYLKIREIISHLDAYKRNGLSSKRMGIKNPNGNIIVHKNGNYNCYDAGIHLDKFNRIKDHYAIGDPKYSKLLTENKINQLAPTFMKKLQTVTGMNGNKPFDIIKRYGIELSNSQSNEFINWVS